MYYPQRKQSFNRGGRFQRPNRSQNGVAIDINKFISRTIQTSPVKEPVHTPTHLSTQRFTDFAISEAVKQAISRRGYTVPTPIQDQAIPFILQGRDLIGLANTGTGKTAAFLIPLLNKLSFRRYQKVLVIAPTRELAVQIEEDCRQLGFNLGFRSALIIGGANQNRQVDNLRRQPNFVIGTPGRLKDLALQGHLNFNQFENIVLDEVDRMFDMGFIKDINFILNALPVRRQSLFFSATLSNEIKKVAGEFLNDPVVVSVKTSETAENVEQDVIRIANPKQKVDVLHDLLIQDEFKKVLIFGKTKWGVRKLADNLNNRGFRSDSIHGDKSQNARQRALNQFKNNELNILVATDVAARGLDIADVTHVINFDIPNTYEDYVHRIGRTGRANNKGKALTFVE